MSVEKTIGLSNLIEVMPFSTPFGYAQGQAYPSTYQPINQSPP